jgi:hypothetical protein
MPATARGGWTWALSAPRHHPEQIIANPSVGVMVPFAKPKGRTVSEPEQASSPSGGAPVEPKSGAI